MDATLQCPLEPLVSNFRMSPYGVPVRCRVLHPVQGREKHGAVKKRYPNATCSAKEVQEALTNQRDYPDNSQKPGYAQRILFLPLIG